MLGRVGVGVGLGVEVGRVGVKSPLQTALNGRPGAVHKAQTKWQIMLDETEPMEFFKLLHFEILLKACSLGVPM